MQICFDVDFKSIRAVIYVIFCHYKFLVPFVSFNPMFNIKFVVSIIACSLFCFGRKNETSPYPVSNFYIGHWMMFMYTVIYMVVWSMCLQWTCCWLHRNPQADLLLHFWPPIQIVWWHLILFDFLFCLLVTCHYQHVLVGWMINFFLDTWVKAFTSIFFSFCSWKIDLHDGHANRMSYKYGWYYLVRPCSEAPSCLHLALVATTPFILRLLFPG